MFFNVISKSLFCIVLKAPINTKLSLILNVYAIPKSKLKSLVQINKQYNIPDA